MATCFDFLKGYLLLGCIFNIGLAIGAIIAGVYLNNMKSEFLVNDSASSVRKYIVIGLYSLGGLCALTGLLGVFAFWKKIKCFQTLFIIFNFIFFLIFAILFAGLMIAQPYLNEIKNSECNSISALKSANDLFVDQFKNKYCKKGSLLNVPCGCKITDPSKWTADELAKLTYKTDQGITTLLECKYPEIQNQINSHDTEISLLEAVESEFDCTGICEGDVIFYFTDINNGPPKYKDGCFSQLRDFILKITGGVFIFIVIATVFTFLNVIIGCINCCCVKAPLEDKPKANDSLEMSARQQLKANLNQQDSSHLQNHMNRPENQYQFNQQGKNNYRIN